MGNKMQFLVLFLISLFGCQAKEEVNKPEDYIIYINRIINSFAKEMKNEFGLKCSGSGGKMPFDVEELMIEFVCYNRATIEKARELEVKATERFIEIINSDEKIRPFLRVYPFTVDRAQVIISFEMPNKKRYTDGSVAYVFQVKNKIFYRADKEGSPVLIPITNEPYDEALKIVRESSQ